MAAEADSINTRLVAVITAASLLILIATILGLQVLFFAMSDTEVAKKDPQAASSVLADYRASQQEKLEGYKVLDPAKGIYAIPIDRAMDLVIREQNAQNSRKEK
jgi:hypothetical protein